MISKKGLRAGTSRKREHLLYILYYFILYFSELDQKLKNKYSEFVIQFTKTKDFLKENVAIQNSKHERRPRM